MSGAVNLLGRSKGLVGRSTSPSGTFELLVGDADGYVSRWQVPKLESLLPPAEGRSGKRGNRDRDGTAAGVGVSAGDILRFL